MKTLMRNPSLLRQNNTTWPRLHPCKGLSMRCPDCSASRGRSINIKKVIMDGRDHLELGNERERESRGRSYLPVAILKQFLSFFKSESSGLLCVSFKRQLWLKPGLPSKSPALTQSPRSAFWTRERFRIFSWPMTWSTFQSWRLQWLVGHLTSTLYDSLGELADAPSLS